MIGISMTITLLTKRFTEVKSLLALSKRSSSFFCVPNARITIIPVRLSRVTRLSLSTIFCIDLNFGRATIHITTITIIKSTIASRIIQLSETPCCNAIIIPPMPIIGAKQISLIAITTNI